MKRTLTTFIILTILFPAKSPSSPQGSPREVLERFCELDAQGRQLTPEGWGEIAPLFTSPAAPRRDKIIIVRDFVVSPPALKGKRAEFYVEYINLGQIDSSLRFSHLPPVKVRTGFDLILIDKTTKGGPDAASTQVFEPARWRIEGTPPEPHLTVEGAIRYVIELRDKSNNGTTRRNADRTIASLKKLAVHP